MDPLPSIQPPHDDHYHLVVVDPTHTRVLTAPTTPGSWLLPSLSFGASSAMRPALVTTSYLARRGLKAMPVHDALVVNGWPSAVAGFNRPVAHRYLALEADATAPVYMDRLAWTPLVDLLETRRRALFPVQETALRTCLQRFRSAEAPFDSPLQVSAAHTWVRERVDAAGATILGEPIPHRLGRYDAVLAFPTTKGSALFKGGPRRMAQDALPTQAMHGLVPEGFPSTVAFNAQRDWWLTWDVGGTDLGADPGSGRVAVRGELWLQAARLLAETQRKALDVPPVLELLADRTVCPTQLAAVAMRVMDLLEIGPYRAHWPLDRLARLECRLERACNRLAELQLPDTWAPAAFVGANLVEREGRIRFTDAENSYLAPPTLAVSRLIEDLRCRVLAPAELLDEVRTTYAEAWRGTLDPEMLRQAMAEPSASICAMLFGFQFHLDRQARQHGLWTSNGHTLPPTRELLDEAHLLGSFVMPISAATGTNG